MPVLENIVNVDRLRQAFRDTSQWNTKILQVYIPTSWLPSRRKVSGRDSQQVADALGAEKGRVAASKKLLSGPKLDAYRRVRNALHKTISRWTWATEAPGMRAIRLRDVEEFEAELDSVRRTLDGVLDAIKRDWAEIMESERRGLGDAFSEKDYRVRWDRLEIGQTRYMELAAVNFLPSSVLEKQRDVIAEETRRVAASAVENAIGPVVESLRVFAQRLEPERRLRPRSDGPYARLDDAELIFKLDEAEDPSIPDGHVRLRVRRQEGKKSVTEDVDVPAADYPLLRPEARGKARMRFDPKAMKAVQSQLEALEHLKGFNGPLTEAIEKAAANLSNLAEGKETGDTPDFKDALRQAAAGLQEISSTAMACVYGHRSL